VAECELALAAHILGGVGASVGGEVPAGDAGPTAVAARAERGTARARLAAAVASQHFLARTDVTQVNLSQNDRRKERNGRRTG
jgi:hypothetical protein